MYYLKETSRFGLQRETLGILKEQATAASRNILSNLQFL